MDVADGIGNNGTFFADPIGIVEPDQSRRRRTLTSPTLLSSLPPAGRERREPDLPPPTPVQSAPMSPTSPAPPTGDRPTVFISYSHKDPEWVEALRIMMAPLTRSGIIGVWWDGEIKAGTAWREEIDHAMAAAQVAVLLASKHFYDSDFIMNEEVPYLLEAAKTRDISILWVPISHALHSHGPFATIQAVHDPKTPLSALKGAELDEALTEICLKIEKAVRRPGEPVELVHLSASQGPTPRLDLGRLPTSGPEFVGRDAEMNRLDAAWDDPATHV